MKADVALPPREHICILGVPSGPDVTVSDVAWNINTGIIKETWDGYCMSVLDVIETLC
jgi:hypothetical protein